MFRAVTLKYLMHITLPLECLGKKSLLIRFIWKKNINSCVCETGQKKYFAFTLLRA